MRWLIFASVCLSCAEPALVSTGSTELQVPEGLEFATTAVGFSRELPLSVVSRGKLRRTVEVKVEGPFEAAATLEVPGAETVDLVVTFRPTASGAQVGTLFIDGAFVQLRGDAVLPAECGVAATCRARRFDPNTLSCVDELLTDETPCTDLLACVDRGACRAGTCVGTAPRCDDGNACTRDACSVGTGCVNAATTCEAPSNPCLAARCDPSQGCVSGPVIDGTPCGAVGCDVANVCLSGTCRVVTPPDGFVCAKATACRAEGICQARQCVQPPPVPLVPRWSYDASSTELRFQGVSDDDGNWYWVECTEGRAEYFCDLKSFTPAGFPRFSYRATSRAHTRRPQPHLLADGAFISAIAGGKLVAVEARDGSERWTSTVAIADFDNVVEFMGAGPHGLWVVTRSSAESEAWLLTRLSTATGATLSTYDLRAKALGLVVHSSGDALIGREQRFEGHPPPRPSGPVVIERVFADGGVSVIGATDTEPVMSVGDTVVLADDATLRLDGSSTNGLSSDSLHWGGVGTETTRFRVRRPLTTVDVDLPHLALDRVQGSSRTTTRLVMASKATDPWLAADGSVFLAVSDAIPVEANSWLLQFDAAGTEAMSCTLTDQGRRLQPGSESGFNGRSFALRSRYVSCPACAVPLWDQPRLVFYDLGTPAPGVASSGWVGPRGTSGSAARTR